MRIYSSQTREKAEFIPIEAGKVRMYVCGPTVYDNIHIGNARTFISFDVIRRWLMASGYEVTFAQNLTDVDDKIINRAAEEGRDPAELAESFAERFIAIMRRAGVLDPDIRPRATREIGPMIGMIKRLIEQGHAYAPGNGDVYFSVRSDPAYGAVSGRHLDDLMAGARIEENTSKRDPFDFALWKAVKPGEPSWKSPWGEGRPGWHTECAAMVHRYLGVPIDIHGGGSDLAFPHHENECAQASCAWHAGFSKIWMHAGMLLVEGEKMSKSLGNFFTLEEVLKRHSAAALRLLMAQTHYRSPLDFSWERLEGAEHSLARVAGTVENLLWAASRSGQGDLATAPREAADTDDDRDGVVSAESLGGTLERAIKAARAEFAAQMDDDFNTAGALAACFSLVSEANAYLDQAGSHLDPTLASNTAAMIRELFSTIGIELPVREGADVPAEIVGIAQELVGFSGETSAEAAEAILAARAEARSERDWARADAIRDQLGAIGLMVEDTAHGSRIKWAQ
ncbi:cysteine--tRNA ligase [Collinsella sp. AGMB00827]|uniref:Cysteine--tRNA ligase n=1 Tax=Collinsella ureilytica TaxID=2869515 RepID=A0ABS7MJ72_9ACTN|nr:cysteine--tRNA ligase [Collinsella urealyticum]MBY4797411.1 cysteine--tRNA ligase [Collinsella urealyticum]